MLVSEIWESSDFSVDLIEKDDSFGEFNSSITVRLSIKKMAPGTGFEPATNGLGNRCNSYLKQEKIAIFP